ncbi:MAG: hypothetical protein AAF959_24220, partial [Cyanobacteria bacterium P01_D01_bin.56]
MRLDNVVGWARPTIQAVLGSLPIMFSTCLSISPAMAQLPDLPPPTSPPPPTPESGPSPTPPEEVVPAATEEETVPEETPEAPAG